MARLDAARVPAPLGRYDVREIGGLLAPVQRYFRALLKDGQPLISSATFELAGRANMSATGHNGKSFTYWQQAVVHRPGFLWNGSVSMFPGLIAHVHDGYLAGVGTLHAAMLGLFTVAKVEDRPRRDDSLLCRDGLVPHSAAALPRRAVEGSR